MPARDVLVLVDADEASWSSWNQLRRAVRRATPARRVVRIDDGGITGPAFFDHVRTLGGARWSTRPRVRTPPCRPISAQRPVIEPTVMWTWSLVSRRDEIRPVVVAAAEAITRDVGDLGLRDPGTWLPAGDPHR